MKGFTKLSVLAVAGALTFGAGVASAQMMGCPWYYDNSVTQAPGAQPQYQGWMGPQMMYNGAWMNGPRLSFEDSQALLQGKLNLNDSQKQAWNDYQAALQASHQKIAKPKVAKDADMQTKLQARIDNLQARLNVAQNLLTARQNLLSVLTPDQTQTLKAFEESMHGPKAKFGPRGPMAPQAANAPAPQQPAAEETDTDTTSQFQGQIYAVPTPNGMVYYLVPMDASVSKTTDTEAVPADQSAPADQAAAPADQTAQVQATPDQAAPTDQAAAPAPVAAAPADQTQDQVAAADTTAATADQPADAAAPQVAATDAAPAQAAPADQTAQAQATPDQTQTAQAAQPQQAQQPQMQIVAVPTQNGVTYYMVPTAMLNQQQQQ